MITPVNRAGLILWTPIHQAHYGSPLISYTADYLPYCQIKYETL